jgi:hypothetical protein
MIFWRGKALYLYSTVVNILGLQRKRWEGLDHLEDDFEVFRKFPVPEGTFGKSFWRLVKLQRSHRVKETWTCSKNLRECLDFLKDDSEDFKKTLSTRRNPWEGFLKVTEASEKLRSHPELSQGSLEHYLLVMVTKFKLSKATLARALVALHSIWRLVSSFVTFRINTMNVYMLACIYYVFLESVGI